ncbi:hypothetical protein [Croceicoccus naphthovorans]|nr:hypothetical protein [Croceicoccus naphthovorans]MBB3991331.1 cell division protein FtsB [Croceicoccus naphthovorans]
MANSTKILVATRELTGGTKKGEIAKLENGEELTAEKQKELGLTNKDIDHLKGRGDIVEVDARVAETGTKGDNAALKAETERAEKAETRVAELEAEVATLTSEKEALQQAVAAAQQKSEQNGN